MTRRSLRVKEDDEDEKQEKNDSDEKEEDEDNDKKVNEGKDDSTQPRYRGTKQNPTKLKRR